MATQRGAGQSIHPLVALEHHFVVVVVPDPGVSPLLLARARCVCNACGDNGARGGGECISDLRGWRWTASRALAWDAASVIWHFALATGECSGLAGFECGVTWLAVGRGLTLFFESWSASTCFGSFWWLIVKYSGSQDEPFAAMAQGGCVSQLHKWECLWQKHVYIFRFAVRLFYE